MTKRKLKVTGKYKNKKEVPQINICGEWLRGIGYDIGAYVVIEYDELKIEIRKS